MSYPRLSDLAWMRRARCSEYDDPDYTDGMFFREASGSHASSKRREWEAVRCYLLCPVRRQCLVHSLSIDTEGIPSPTGDGRLLVGRLAGVWAGINEAERSATRHLPLEDRGRVLDRVARGKACEVLLSSEQPAAQLVAAAMDVARERRSTLMRPPNTRLRGTSAIDLESSCKRFRPHFTGATGLFLPASFEAEIGTAVGIEGIALLADVHQLTSRGLSFTQLDVEAIEVRLVPGDRPR